MIQLIHVGSKNRQPVSVLRVWAIVVGILVIMVIAVAPGSDNVVTGYGLKFIKE